MLEAQAIEEADVVLLAADIEVDVTRFAGKRVFRCGTGVALKQPDATLDRALEEGAVLAGGAAASASGEQKGEKAGVYKHLLTGVSYMLPMVVAVRAVALASLCVRQRLRRLYMAAALRLGSGAALGLTMRGSP